METEKKDSKKFAQFIDKYGQLILNVIFFGLVFWYIQKPEFLLNKNKTKSELAREQAKLFIDLLNEPELSKLKNGYKVIRLSYVKQDTTFFQEFDSLFDTWIKDREKDVLMTKYQELIIKRAELIRKFNKDYEGIGDWEIGKSKIAPDISYILNYLDLQIKETENELINYNIELKTLQYYKEFNSLMNE